MPSKIIALPAPALGRRPPVGRGDVAGQRRGGGHVRAGQVDLAAGMAHAADEVAVGGRHGALALGEDAHVAAEAGAAGRRAEGAARLDEGLHGAVGDRVETHLLRARQDDAAHVRVNLLAAQDRGRLTQVREAAVGAAADDDLVDPDVRQVGGRQRRWRAGAACSP